MNRLRYISILFGLVGIFTTGCSLLVAPVRPTVPPPPPTAAPINFSAGQPLVNPSSSVRVNLDPDIVALMNAVSEQQLQAYVQALQDFHTRNSFSETEREDVGIGAARRWIYNEFIRVGQGRLNVAFEDFPLIYEGLSTTQRNIVATLPGVGSYPGVVVIGAHYDSRVESDTDGVSFAPAANDNGSGVATLLELARLLSARQWNQTIIFVAFAAEEQGTVGSRYFVTNSLLAGRQIDLAISNDGVGGRPGIPQTVRLFAPDMQYSNAGQAARYVHLMGSLYLPSFPVELQNALDREGRYGDQREFLNAGLAAVRLIESQEDPSLLNSTRDTWEKIDYQYVAHVVRLNLAVVSNWAGAPPPPPAPSIAKTAEPGAFIVTWQTDPLAAGYAISFRPVASLVLPEFRYVNASEAGNVVLTGYDPTTPYAVSVAPIGPSGRLGGFSPETVVVP